MGIKGVHANKKFNPIKIVDDIAYLTLFNKPTKVKIDIADIPKVKMYCWYLHHSGYIVSRNKGTKGFGIHQIIMGECQEGYEIDHVNRDKSDNRRCNLRFVNRSQNCFNRGLFKNNKSGYAGVYFYKPYNKWLAYIRVNGNRIHIGYFDNIEDAIKARKETEKIYFKEVI